MWIWHQVFSCSGHAFFSSHRLILVRTALHVPTKTAKLKIFLFEVSLIWNSRIIKLTWLDKIRQVKILTAILRTSSSFICLYCRSILKDYEENHSQKPEECVGQLGLFSDCRLSPRYLTGNTFMFIPGYTIIVFHPKMPILLSHLGNRLLLGGYFCG